MRHQCTVVAVLLLTALNGACSRNPEILKREYLERGDGYVAKKAYAEAILEYRNAVAQDSNFGEARFKLGKAYEAIGDGQNAYREYVRAADLLPDNVDAQLSAAKARLGAAQYPEARARAEEVLARDPKNVDALIVMGNALAGLKDLDAAISQIEEAIESDPHRTLSYANLGALQLIKGDQAAAEAVFQRAVKLDPKSLSAHLSLANYYWAAGRIPEAEGEFKTSLEIDPRSPNANQGIAALYLNTGDRVNGEKYLKALSDLSSKMEPKLMLADFYLVSGKEKDARPMLEKLAQEQEGFIPATLRLATLDYAAGNARQAYEALDSVLKRAPRDEGALLVKGRLLLRDGKPADALVLARQATDGNPQSVPGQFLKGAALEATGSPEAAITAFQEVLRINPSAVPAQIRLANLFLTQGNGIAANEFANQAVRTAPSSPDAHFVLAKTMVTRGNLTGAEAELSDLLKTQPSLAAVHILAGRLYWVKGDAVRARAEYTRGLELEPKSLEALEGLIGADLYSKNRGAARVRIDSALSSQPKTAKLWLLAGRTYFSLGDPKEAESAFNKALQIDQANMEAYQRLATVYMSQQRLDEALKQYDAAARQQSKPVMATTMAGVILTMQGKQDEARKRYEEALAADPNAAVAANNLAWSYADKNENLDVALQLAQTAKGKLPNNADVSDTLGWIYYKKGLAGLAITALKDGVTQNRSNPLIHYHLGLAYAKNGNRPEAKQSLEEALKLDPRFAGADDAKRVLGTLKG